MTRPEKPSSPLWVAVSWALVLAPLGWGVVQSVVKSLPLFQTTAPANAGPSPTEK